MIPKRNVDSRNTLGTAQNVYNNLVFEIYPCDDFTNCQGSTTVYEDNGLTIGYLYDEGTEIEANYDRNATNILTYIKATVKK